MSGGIQEHLSKDPLFEKILFHCSQTNVSFVLRYKNTIALCNFSVEKLPQLTMLSPYNLAKSAKQNAKNCEVNS